MLYIFSGLYATKNEKNTLKIISILDKRGA